MVFSSTLFLFRFLPIFFIFYFMAPGRMKNVILLLGSLFFYAWGEPVYVLLILFTTLSDYWYGRVIESNKRKGAKTFFLVNSILINLLVLGFFKYADFLTESCNRLLGTTFPLWELPVPIGISFYTLQCMSYVIDCYRGKVKAQRNFLDFAVYVTMFPQLLLGPIVKYSLAEKQLCRREPDIIRISYGCKRFVTGLAKKVLLANQLGMLWMEVAGNDFAELPVMIAWLGVAALGLQIYFEFSGFADMAIGLGACLGFDFPENFNYPYISASVTEFWCRWNMTLTGWLREYVYIPMGGNRKGLFCQIINILVVWLLAGIWHGAGWNYLLWGIWFAFWLILEKLFLKNLLKKLPGQLGNMYTLFIVAIGWVVFAIPQISEGIRYLSAMFGLNGAGLYSRESFYFGLKYMVLFIISFIAATPLFHRIAECMSHSVTGYGIATYRVLEKLILPILLIASIAHIVDGSYNPFLYFQL